MVDKRYVKMGIAGSAALALVIGLAVGLSQKNAANRSASASLNMDMGGMYADACFEEVEAPAMTETPPPPRGGKSGKGSKGSGSKGSKSRREMMVVPGTEEYVEGLQVDEFQRSKIRAVVTKGLGDEEAPTRRLSEMEGGSSKGSKSDMSYSSKGSKSDMSYSSKGSKSGDGSSKGSKGCYNVCSKGSKGSDGSSKGSKSDMSYSGKGGKSGDGSGKSGKSGDMSYSSKGSKSGGDGSSKGSKSDMSYSSKGSKSGAPSVCADCDCEEEERDWLGVDGKCIFAGCEATCDDFLDAEMCTVYASETECCEMETMDMDMCKVLDVCSPGSSSKSGKSSTSKASKSSPTPAPVGGGSLTPRPSGEIDFRTPEPTVQGTTTVAKDAYTGEPPSRA